MVNYNTVNFQKILWDITNFRDATQLHFLIYIILEYRVILLLKFKQISKQKQVPFMPNIQYILLSLVYRKSFLVLQKLCIKK